jgi:hypothetical protein
MSEAPQCGCSKPVGVPVAKMMLSGPVATGATPAGTCIAALVEESTAQFVDIATDAFDREAVAVTALRPSPCF